MNPYRRVGVVQIHPLQKGDDDKLDSVHPTLAEVEQDLQTGRRPHRLETSVLWMKKIDLIKVNATLSVLYVCLGLIIVLLALIFRPQNYLTNSRTVCSMGICSIRDETRTPTELFRNDIVHGVFHPNFFTPIICGLIFIAYGGLVLSGLTRKVINAGHILNWVVVASCWYASVDACAHTSNLFFKNPYAFSWTGSATRTVLIPMILTFAALLVFIQATVNLPNLRVCKIRQYSDTVAQGSDLSKSGNYIPTPKPSLILD
ncbi:unnamed protein product [Calicophoron daubneyi]|uniref:Uncharacterized protein n=1 Tax=Calicophoron daubneyi TaxID=300641 RepID=A0AAV2T9S7_CALDB